MGIPLNFAEKKDKKNRDKGDYLKDVTQEVQMFVVSYSLNVPSKGLESG